MKIECMLKAAGLIAITYYVIKSIDNKKKPVLPEKSESELEQQIGRLNTIPISTRYRNNGYRRSYRHHSL